MTVKHPVSCDYKNCPVVYVDALICAISWFVSCLVGVALPAKDKNGCYFEEIANLLQFVSAKKKRSFVHTFVFLLLPLKCFLPFAVFLPNEWVVPSMRRAKAVIWIFPFFFYQPSFSSALFTSAALQQVTLAHIWMAHCTLPPPHHGVVYQFALGRHAHQHTAPFVYTGGAPRTQQ